MAFRDHCEPNQAANDPASISSRLALREGPPMYGGTGTAQYQGAGPDSSAQGSARPTLWVRSRIQAWIREFFVLTLIWE